MSTPWPSIPLSEVLTLQRRWLEPELMTDYIEIGVRSFGRGIFFKAPMSGASLGDKRVLRIEPGDLVFMNVFAWEGAVAVAGSDALGKIGSHRFATYTPHCNRVDVRFLNLFFQTRDGRELLGRISPGSALRNRTMNLAEFSRQAIPLPPIGEQLRIVSQIEALTDKIAQAKQASVNVTLQCNSMLSSLFRQLSQDAPMRRLGDVAPLTRRPALIDSTKKYPQVSVRSFGRGTFHSGILEGSEITWEKPHLVNAGDILISNIKAWEGAIAVATEKDDGRYGSHRYLTYVPVRGVATSRWVCHFLQSPEGLYFVGEASPGSADRNRTTSAKALLEIPLPVPLISVQERFDAAYAKVAAISTLQAQAAAESDVLLPSLLERAFKGAL